MISYIFNYLSKIIRKLRNFFKHYLIFLWNYSEIKDIKKEIKFKRRENFKILSFVITHAAQQHFFLEIHEKCKHEKYFIFIVNPYKISFEDKIFSFKDIKFITNDVYDHLIGIDLALHTEIHCRSYGAADICFIGHGFQGKHSKWSYENIKSFNHYFLYGPRDRALIEFFSKKYLYSVDHMNLWEVGYPKYDKQFTGFDDCNLIKQRLGINPMLKTVLFAPAWDPGGLLQEFGPSLLNEIGKLKDFNVIVKFHPASLVSRSSRDYNFYTGGINWREAINEAMVSHPNISFYDELDITPLFKICDVMITDFSGVALGFFLEDKPVVCVDCPRYYKEILPAWGEDGDLSRNNELFNNGRDASYIVEDIKSLNMTVCHAAANKDEFSEKRRKIATALLYNRGVAAQRMADCIKEILYKG